MDRRTFFLSAAGAAPVAAVGQSPGSERNCHGGPSPLRPAGMTPAELHQRYRRELFDVLLPFWDAHGIDHARGGIFHALDYDGARKGDDKLLWFQGRAIWVYSFLYNYFGKDARHLEIARKTKDFVLRHAPQPDGWWAEVLAPDGSVRRPFRGDVYGMYFVAEGLQEYAWAAGDEEALETALGLMRKLYGYIGRPGFRYVGTGKPGVRPQGLWMVNLRIATQMLRRWEDAAIEEIAARAVEAVIEKHYNPDIGLNNEMLNFDFSRPPEEANKSLLGHSIETLWMVMDEAERRGDERLWKLCAERIRRHLQVGWDYVFGGLAHWVNVDAGAYVWPPERPVGTDLEFRFVGEYHYMKSLWALNEILIATLNVFRRTGAEWAARFFGMAQKVIDEKFSRRRRGLPGYMLFGDRRMTPQPHVARQDNYHPLRQLMLNLLALQEMKREAGRA